MIYVTTSNKKTLEQHLENAFAAIAGCIFISAPVLLSGFGYVKG